MASVNGLLLPVFCDRVGCRRLPQIGKKRAEQIVAARGGGDGFFTSAASMSRIGFSVKQCSKVLKAYAKAVAAGKLAIAAAKARNSL